MSSASTTPAAPQAPSQAAAATPDDLFDADDQRPRWLVVRSEGRRFGIPIEQVREVFRPTNLRRVPGAPAVQVGVINVRGAIVTVLDMASAVTPGQVRAASVGSIVLIQYGTRPLGLAVDSVEDVDFAEEGDAAGIGTVTRFDAMAWCTQQLHSAEERER